MSRKESERGIGQPKEILINPTQTVRVGRDSGWWLLKMKCKHIAKSVFPVVESID